MTRRRGIDLPLYVDPVAVERAAAGDRGCRLTRLEKVAAVQWLAARGYTESRIAVTLGCSNRTVARLRALPAVGVPELGFVVEEAS